MSKRLRVIICTMISVALLTGCQLAKEETALGQEKDKLIGVYMTTEYVDTFDFEGYMKDNLDDIMKGKERLLKQKILQIIRIGYMLQFWRMLKRMG